MRKKAIKVMRALRKIGYLAALHSVLLPLIAISMYRHHKQDDKEEKKE
jgi:hypothetical protein|tara:strand:+ start:3253 stop:3396 length:144 start_codon:yes stop_codon:yes gene_type:complete